VPHELEELGEKSRSDTCGDAGEDDGKPKAERADDEG